LLSSAQRNARESLKRALDDLKRTVQDLQRTNEALHAEGCERKQAEQKQRRSEAYLAEAKGPATREASARDLSLARSSGQKKPFESSSTTPPSYRL